MPNRLPVPEVRPWLVPTLAAGFIAVLFGLILLVDVAGAFGGIPTLEAMNFDPAATWFQAFQDRGAAEFAQWALLGWLIVMAATLRGALADRDPELSAFWRLIAIFGVMLLAEDAGDVRMTLRHWADAFGPNELPLGTLGILVWFAAIVAVLAYALWTYRHRLTSDRAVVGYGLAGIGFLAAGSLGEFVEQVVNWFRPVGEYLVLDLFNAPQMVTLEGRDPEFMTYLFTDFIVEEPLELLGMACLVAATLAFVRAANRGEAGVTDTTDPDSSGRQPEPVSR